MFELKRLSAGAIPGALAKAERYRLLNEPLQAESICRDILTIQPEHQEALVTLLLALTDQFEQGISVHEAVEVINRMSDAYARAYYSGIVDERRAIALFRQNDFRSGHTVYMLLLHAMEWYERAQAIRPEGNDDSLLRWNACARFLDRHSQLSPEKERTEPVLSE